MKTAKEIFFEVTDNGRRIMKLYMFEKAVKIYETELRRKKKSNRVEAQVKPANGEQIDAINDLLFEDSHQFSKRPCETCRKITEIIGKDFGCVRLAKQSRLSV